MKRFLSIIPVFLVIFSHSKAQQIRPDNSGKIYGRIQQLKNLTKVLYFAAHPDDENTRLLAWLVNDRHINTAYLSLTRGDGGQNILGGELGPALGLIRTYELLEARKLDGAKQFFTRAIDFGFSKNYEETFKHWNQYILINDAVRIIREFRPDVIICRFPPDTRAGHGQHAASAIIAGEAFRMSGDKLQFTEHFQSGLKPWKPKRILWNTYRFGSRNTTSEDQFKTEVGQYSPVMGMGYGELAGISRSIHRSQGAGTPSVPGIQKEYFQLVDGDSLSQTLFDGIDVTWNRVNRPEIGNEIQKISEAFDFVHPEKSLPALLALRKKIETVKDTFWREEKLKDLDEIILSTAGFMAEATTPLSQAVAGETVPYTLRFIVRAGIPIEISAPENVFPIAIKNLQKDSLYAFDRMFKIPENQEITAPYWLKEPPAGDLFTIPSDTLIGLPETPDELTIPVFVTIGSQQFPVNIPLSYKKLDPVRGDVIEKLRIVPEISIKPASGLLITGPDGSFKTSIQIRAFKTVENGTLNIYGNNKNLLSIKGISAEENSDTSVNISFSGTQMEKAGNNFVYLEAELEAEGKKYDRSLELIQYEHLPTLQYFSPAYAKIIQNDWKVTAKRIGFIEGAGDYTVTLLKLAGLNVDILKPEDFSSAANLKKYDAIITGIRALNIRKNMKYWMPVLLEYTRSGGTLVLQYNTLQDLATTDFAPFPIDLSAKRVTEENAPVKFLLPEHRLLNYPNRITEKDFENWVQERGLYFPEKWNDRYQALFQMHDTGEEPLSGSTLYTDYGKGHFIYTSLSFFRQLPAGNKGAIRLLMNMISVGK